MAAFLVRRLIQGVIVVAFVATIVFLLLHLAPGDPYTVAMDNAQITADVLENWRHSAGLDLPVWQQFTRYVANVFRGDLGFSYTGRPVLHALRDAIPNTLLLMAVGIAGGFALGIAVAIAQVKHQGKWVDRALGWISMIFFAFPDFWLALLVVLSLSSLLHLPLGGAVDMLHDDMGPAARIGDRITHLILPALTLTLLYFPIIARHQRAALMDVLPSEYIAAARAKGVDERTLIRRHALRNALLPVITILGVAFPALLTGAVFIEYVFSWPGMGYLIVTAINGRDYPLLTAAVILGGAFVVIGSLLADTLYRLLDPRIRDDR